MRAVRVTEFTDPQEYIIEEIPTPTPGPGELLVAIHTAAINFGDTLIATGRYQVRPKRPFTPGAEFSGTVVAVGDSVTEFEQGDRIAAMGFVGSSRSNERIMGGCAEMAIVPVRNALRLFESIELEQAALFRSNTETAYFGLVEGRLRMGETLLVLGASGGTGYAAVALGKLMGARVIASASTETKRNIALAAGANIAIDNNAPDWRAQVDAFAGPNGVQVVYDPVGGDYTERAFRTLGYGGRHLVIGFAAGTIPKLPVNLPLMKGASLVGANLLRAWENDPISIERNAKFLIGLFARREISVPPVARRYTLTETAEAMRDVASGKTAGRVVISVHSQH